MKRSNLVQAAIVLASAAAIVLFVLRERLQEWVSPPHFEARKTPLEVEDPWVYYCPMDGFQRSDAGICGICKMPLTDEHRVRRSEIGKQARISLGSRTVQMVGLQTQPVEERALAKEIRAVGRIAPDERLTRGITARVEGRLEHIFKNFVGAEVAEGEPLALIYSPDLVATQEELLIAVRTRDERSAEPARKRLRLWGIDDKQIAEVEKEGKAKTQMTLPSPAGGVVMTLLRRNGHWVKEGDEIMEVVDLSTVWLKADVYEYEIPFLRVGQAVEITAPAFPGETFRGTISYLHSFLDEKSRTLHVRMDVPNPGRRLLPGMFVTAQIRADLGPGGVPVGPGGEIEVDEFFCHLHGPAQDPAKCPVCGGKMDTRKVKKVMDQEITVYVCGPCCPHIRMDKPGKCPECPMTLKEKKEKAVPKALAVPRESVFDSGRAQHLFVEVGPGQYERRDVKLGPRAGDFFPVRDGVRKGERVVTRGGYLLDSQSQISGGGASALYSGATEVKEEKGHKH